MDQLIKAECAQMLKELEHKFYERLRRLQRDIINATAKQYGYDRVKALRDYNLDIEYPLLVDSEPACQSEEYSEEALLKEEKKGKNEEEKEEEKNEEEKEEEGKKAKKKGKEPKKPVTSYSYFIKEKKTGFAKEFPELAPAEVTKKLREWWHKIKGGTEAEIYNELNVKDKVRYDEEMLVYSS